MSRVFLGVALGLLLAGGAVLILERVRRSYNKGREDVIEEIDSEISAASEPVDGKA